MALVLREPYASLYEEFLAYQKPRTSGQGYKAAVARLRVVAGWLDKEDVLPEEAAIQDVLRFKKESGERLGKTGNPVSLGTILNYLHNGRAFFDYLIQTGRRKTNPFREVAYPRSPDHLSRNVLSVAQMHTLLEALAKFYEIKKIRPRLERYRLHVLSEFLYATGLRIAEAAGLTETNLDLDRRMVYVPEGKGGIPRTVFLTGYAAEVMGQFLLYGRPALEAGGQGQGRNGTLFGACHDRLKIFLNRELKKICAALELPGITSHGFRHSLGTHLLKAGCDMRHIQVILGHERLGTTQIYTHVDKEDLKKSLDTFHPRQWPNTPKEIPHA
jgi:site-specific recombinase XerD